MSEGKEKYLVSAFFTFAVLAAMILTASWGGSNGRGDGVSIGEKTPSLFSAVPISAAPATADILALTANRSAHRSASFQPLPSSGRPRSRPRPRFGSPRLPPNITQVTISCAITTLQAGQTDQCTATVEGIGSLNSAVTWSASSGTISSSGFFTAPSIIAATLVTITATSVQDRSKAGSITLTVNPAAPSFNNIPDITISELGMKISPSLDISLFEQGGLSPLTYVVSSQSAPSNIDCYMSGSLLESDYAYVRGTNTIIITVTDANGEIAQTSINVIVNPPTVVRQIYGIDYGPYVGSQNPDHGTVIDDDQLIQQIGTLVPYVTSIRTFGCTHGLQNVARIAKRFGLKVLAGVWIGSDSGANDAEIASCIDVARTVPVDAIIIGSEAVLRNEATPAQLIEYINEFRSAVPNVPIATADAYIVLANNPNLVEACDFIFVNYYPFWEGRDLSTAVAYLNAQDLLLRAKYPSKEVIISETGWQSFGQAVGDAVPSPANAAFYFLNFESWAQAGERKSFYFEAHDEPWKGADDGWGIWDANLAMKPGMMDVFNGATMQDSWTCAVAPGGDGAPTLEFTYVPDIGSGSFLNGQEWHVNPAAYYVVVYIHVGSYGWWVKPYEASPLSPINCDGTWSTDIVTGESDTYADQVAAFLIPASYSPPKLMGAQSLPIELYANSIANTSVTR